MSTVTITNMYKRPKKKYTSKDKFYHDGFVYMVVPTHRGECFTLVEVQHGFRFESVNYNMCMLNKILESNNFKHIKKMGISISDLEKNHKYFHTKSKVYKDGSMYMIADTGNHHYTLINMETGKRYTDISYDYEDLRKLLQDENFENIGKMEITINIDPR